MKALAVTSPGSTATVVEVDTPTPGAGDVLVKVAAASVNGFDLAVAGGMLEGMMEHRYPVVIGKDFAGVVAAVGEGVDTFAVGDRVFGVVTRDFLGDGSIGEFVAVPATVGVAHTPAGVPDREAAALGLAGVTALAAVDGAQLTPESVVLVSGATGGVGTQVVQLAAAAGATVIATARGDVAAALVSELGATEVVDYTEDVAAAVRASHPNGADVVFHFAGDAAALVPALADGGRFVTALLMSADQLPLENGTVVPVLAVPTAEALETVARSHADGSARIRVDHLYPLADAAEALARFGTGKLGKIVIAVA
jgi:NADPH:quinone reductase-like Zn-dependent oxidoreductase